MVIGVVIVTFNAEDVISPCLRSLFSSIGGDLRVIVVDNASCDDTVGAVRQFVDRAELASHGDESVGTDVPGTLRIVESTKKIPALQNGEVGLIRSPENLGFAGGVNLGLKSFLDMPFVEAMWILNPDCVVEPSTAGRLAERARQVGSYGIIGGRIYYDFPQFMIQSDGGTINLWTGTCHPFNMTRIGQDIPGPIEEDLDYIPGTHMLVSREFISCAGLMPENYFLYYEEMEWCLRRGNLPLLFCADAAVHHIGGQAAGSATINNGPSPLSAYFMARSRMQFVARMKPAAIPIAFVYVFAKALRCIARRQVSIGFAMLRGLSGLGPTKEALNKIGRTELPS